MLAIKDTESSLPVNLHALIWRYQTVITRLYVTCKTNGKILDNVSNDQIAACRKLVAVPPLDDSHDLGKLKMVFHQLADHLSGDQVRSDKVIDELLFGLYRPAKSDEQDKGEYDEERVKGALQSAEDSTKGHNASRWAHHI
jgi:hypothetical protein